MSFTQAWASSWENSKSCIGSYPFVHQHNNIYLENRPTQYYVTSDNCGNHSWFHWTGLTSVIARSQRSRYEIINFGVISVSNDEREFLSLHFSFQSSLLLRICLLLCLSIFVHYASALAEPIVLQTSISNDLTLYRVFSSKILNKNEVHTQLKLLQTY